MQKKKSAHPWITAVLGLGALALAVAAHAGTKGEGFYIGLDLGLAKSEDLDSAVSAVNHPTRCDQLLDPDTNVVPLSDPACQVGSARALLKNSFDLDTGFVGAATVGYRLSDNLRIELEYLYRSHRGETNLFRPAGGNAALESKASEWSTIDPPSESVSDFTAHQFFANAYYDFLNTTSWTPYVGAGVGWSRTHLRYRTRFVRKTLAQGYPVDASDPDIDVAQPPAAAGTVSLLDTDITETPFGFQLLAGMDYALSEAVSVGVKGRWARFEDIEDEDVWNLIRSHEPVRADGTTPFTSTQKFEDPEYWAVTVGLKYHF